MSGNPSGKPKGSKNIRTYVRDLLFTDDVYKYTSDPFINKDIIPVKAIITMLIEKAIQGDIKAASMLFNYADVDFTEDSNHPVALVEFVNPPSFPQD